jgi:GNAT superfamily N-acetyltransferase
MSKIEVRTFDVTEWQEYRDMRLLALQDSPDAFGSTFEGSRIIPDKDWMIRLECVTPESDFPAKATLDGEFAGLAWGRIEPSNLAVAYLYQMWVPSEYRSMGVGKALLLAVLDWSKSQGVEVLKLGVTCGDSPARKLYESQGFVAVGGVEPLRPGSEVSVQNMEFGF